MRLLIVKTSSLGDIVHALPALEDARRAVPGLRCDWLAERAFAQVPAWHPSVERVIESDLRGWRRDLRATLAGGAWAAFRAALRTVPYDLIIDAQGLVKSAWLASQAHGPLAGPGFRAAREPWAALWYDRRYAIPRHDQAHAVERNRRLFAQALGYALPEAPPEAGLSREAFAPPALDESYVVFLHGTTWPSKRWPIASWQALGSRLAERGLRIVLPWGSAAEQADAQAIAEHCAGLVLPRLDLQTLAGWLAHARFVVGVDTGLAHLTAALAVPQLSLYGPTLPELTGAVGPNQRWLKSSTIATIDRARPTTVGVDAAEQALRDWL